MAKSGEGVPYSLETIQGKGLQSILDRFALMFPFPLLLINSSGTVLGSAAMSAQAAAGISLRIDVERGCVRECGNALPSDSRELLSAPIFMHGDLLGYVAGYAANTVEIEALHAQKLRIVAEFIGNKAYTEYELQSLTEELLEKYSEITLIYDISEALSAEVDRQAVCSFIIKQIVDVVRVGRASIMLYDKDSDSLYVAESHGLKLSKDEIRKIRVAPNENVSGTVFSTGRHMLIENVQDDSFLDLPVNTGPYEKNSFLCIPIAFHSENKERKVMGVINLTNKMSSDMFTADDQRLLSAIASQAALALHNIQLVEEARDNERVKREMEIAQLIQTRLLPSTPPSITGLGLAGRCLPATQVGGDYYGFFPHSASELGVVIADVSGHDIGSAFIMATARSSLRSEVLDRKSPARVLKDTNSMLYDDLNNAEKFITMFYAEFDGGTNLLRYSNAAHNPPFLLRNGACRLLDTDGMFIGMWGPVYFEEKIIHLLPNDFVILYTDGVVEAKNEANEMFSTERLVDLLEATHHHVTAQELLERIYDDVAHFSGNAERSDDITVVVLKVRDAA